MTRPDVFLDTSALIAGLLSDSGGARALFALGEAQALQLWCSQDVLAELDTVLRQKIPQQLPVVSAWLARIRIELVQPPSIKTTRKLHRLVGHPKDPVVLAGAVDAKMDYLVTLDREHMLSNPSLRKAHAFPIGTPGDCLAWFRDHR
jgi:putative PIN family toxin of toxin-antitoxin system